MARCVNCYLLKDCPTPGLKAMHTALDQWTCAFYTEGPEKWLDDGQAIKKRVKRRKADKEKKK